MEKITCFLGKSAVQVTVIFNQNGSTQRRGAEHLVGVPNDTVRFSNAFNQITVIFTDDGTGTMGRIHMEPNIALVTNITNFIKRII